MEEYNSETLHAGMLYSNKGAILSINKEWANPIRWLGDNRRPGNYI